MKVKSLITELINQLQDTLERLKKNQLVENDELEFGQPCDSEHFPTKKGRNLNPESEVFMFGPVISGALGQDPGVDRFPTRRTDQSKASKDSCGLGLRCGRRRLIWVAQRKR